MRKSVGVVSYPYAYRISANFRWSYFHFGTSAINYNYSNFCQSKDLILLLACTLSLVGDWGRPSERDRESEKEKKKKKKAGRVRERAREKRVLERERCSTVGVHSYFRILWLSRGAFLRERSGWEEGRELGNHIHRKVYIAYCNCMMCNCIAHAGQVALV